MRKHGNWVLHTVNCDSDSCMSRSLRCHVFKRNPRESAPSLHAPTNTSAVPETPQATAPNKSKTHSPDAYHLQITSVRTVKNETSRKLTIFRKTMRSHYTNIQRQPQQPINPLPHSIPHKPPFQTPHTGKIHPNRCLEDTGRRGNDHLAARQQCREQHPSCNEDHA